MTHILVCLLSVLMRFSSFALVQPIAAGGELLQDLCFCSEPLLPGGADQGFGVVAFGEVDEEAVVAGFGDHELVVEFTEGFVFEVFGEEAEAFAAAGFYEGTDQEPVQ